VTLLAELEARKSQQRARTHKTVDKLHNSTLLERDALAEVKKEARRRGPVGFSWQVGGQAIEEAEDDVPLGVLYASKLASRPEETSRRPGLLALREAEDNEPLRKRQERLKQQTGHIKPSPNLEVLDENETLGQRKRRLQAAQQQHISGEGNEIATSSEVLEHQVQKPRNSMSTILLAQPQKQLYTPQLSTQGTRGLLGTDLPFGYQAQQEMHGTFLGQQSNHLSHFPAVYNFNTQYQYDNATSYQPREVEYGTRFQYAPVNAQYLQQQQAILADQIEKWRSSVW